MYVVVGYFSGWPHPMVTRRGDLQHLNHGERTLISERPFGGKILIHLELS